MLDSSGSYAEPLMHCLLRLAKKAAHYSQRALWQADRGPHVHAQQYPPCHAARDAGKTVETARPGARTRHARYHAQPKGVRARLGTVRSSVPWEPRTAAFTAPTRAAVCLRQQ